MNKEREVREQTEEELMKTMVSLSSCQKEARVLTDMLSTTQDELQEKIQALAREEEAHKTVREKLDQTTEVLGSTNNRFSRAWHDDDDHSNSMQCTIACNAW